MRIFKSYNFWVRLVAVLVLLARVVGAEFGINIDSGLIIDIATVVASILVVLGIIQAPSADGGNGIMKTIEQIKTDINSVKEKLIEKYGNDEGVIEFASLIDGIFCEEPIKEEPVEVSAEILVDDSVVEPTVIIEPEVEGSVKEESQLIVEPIENITEIDKEKLNEVLKAKIKEVIDRDMDEIISAVING